MSIANMTRACLGIARDTERRCALSTEDVQTFKGRRTALGPNTFSKGQVKNSEGVTMLVLDFTRART